MQLVLLQSGVCLYGETKVCDDFIKGCGTHVQAAHSNTQALYSQAGTLNVALLSWHLEGTCIITQLVTLLLVAKCSAAVGKKGCRSALNADCVICLLSYLGQSSVIP